MKKILILLFIFSTYYSFGQDRRESKEKIKALKVAYLTDQLELTSNEAQSFWPLYNKHQEKLEFLRSKGRTEIRKKIIENKNTETLNEASAKNFVMLKLELDKKIVLEKEDFILQISKFLPYKKIFKLHLSEREFARKLMRKYGRGRK